MATTPTILAATDLTDASTAAVDFAAQLAELLHGKLVLAHVVDTAGRDPRWEGADLAVRPYIDQLRERLNQRLDSANQRLDQEQERCRSRGIDVSTQVVSGHVWEAILHAQEELAADFVVVGPHGVQPSEALLGPLRERLLGSTADKMVRHAKCPVWVVPSRPAESGSEESAFARTAVAVDFSEESQEATRIAADLTKRAGGSLSLVHIVPPGHHEVDTPRSWQEALHAAVRDRATRKLNKVASQLEGVDVSIQIRNAQSRLDAELINDVDGLTATALVMGSHGRKGVRHMVLGSTAERCLRRSSIPVLVVKRPRT